MPFTIGASSANVMPKRTLCPTPIEAKHDPSGTGVSPARRDGMEPQRPAHGPHGHLPSPKIGRVAARHLAPLLASRGAFALVLTSPLQRARETCQLAGLGTQAEVDADLLEWDYGTYEGLTPRQILAERPTWMIFRDGCPGGETPSQVGERVDRVIARARAATGNVALFGHGHALRVFAARWLGWHPSARQPLHAQYGNGERAEYLSRHRRHQTLERAPDAGGAVGYF